jgi:hypothetical protein
MASVPAHLRVGLSLALKGRVELDLNAFGALDVRVFELKMVNERDVTLPGRRVFDAYVDQDPYDYMEMIEVMRDARTFYTYKPASATLSWERPAFAWDAPWLSGSAVILKSRYRAAYTPICDELSFDIDVRVEHEVANSPGGIPRSAVWTSHGKRAMAELTASASGCAA